MYTCILLYITHGNYKFFVASLQNLDLERVDYIWMDKNIFGFTEYAYKFWKIDFIKIIKFSCSLYRLYTILYKDLWVLWSGPLLLAMCVGVCNITGRIYSFPGSSAWLSLTRDHFCVTVFLFLLTLSKLFKRSLF